MNASVEAMVRQASLLSREGRTSEAIEAYQRVLALWPALPDTWYNLAVQLRKGGRYPQALTAYQQALERGVKRPEEAHLNRGVIYSDCLRQYAAAERELRCALALNPSYVPALLNLANLHEDLGRREAALAVYERLLALDPHHADALARLANLTTVATIDDALIERLRQALSQPAAGAAERASLGFALGRALDAKGRYAAAFDVYSRANRDSRDSAPAGFVPYDRTLAAGLVDRLIAAFPAAGRDIEIERPATRPYPIFVCGMFRSGSTLVEQIIGSHARVSAGGELDFLPTLIREALSPFPESMSAQPASHLEALAARYLRALGTLFPSAELVSDKRPDNFLFIGLIKRLFPRAKIVHTVRDPLDTCLSIFFLHLDHRMSYALDLMDIGHQYRQYQRLMAHWRRIHGADIIEVSYDALVQEPKSVAQELLASLGLDWEEGWERCLTVPASGNPIKTASVWQVREPIYARSSGRARHYGRQLAALREYLEKGD